MDSEILKTKEMYPKVINLNIGTSFNLLKYPLILIN